MSATMVPEGLGTGLSRPFTLGTFQNRLNQFEELIREITLQDVEATPEERRQMITENLRFDQFCDSIRALFGGDVRSNDLKAIYRKISTNPDAKVDWSELFGYFQLETEEQEVAVGEEVNVFTMSARKRVAEAAGDKKRRDIIVAIKYIPGQDAYVTASQKGAISVYTSKFRLQACIDLDEAGWVTGCDFLPVLRRLAICTERSLCIWDSRAKGKNQAVFAIKPIEHSPQCVAWVPYTTKLVSEDVLLYGDDQGYINFVTLSPKDFAPRTKDNNMHNRYSQSLNLDPTKLTYPIKRRKFHDDWVLKIKWFPDLNCFGSCSPSSTSSFVLEEVGRVLDENEIRGVSIPKGVNAFDYCARANIIATGGVDKVIRVWHPHIFSRPTGKLIGHLFTIVDIVSNEKDQHLISLSTARVVRIWDIHTLTSLQVFTDNEDRPGEKRIYSILFNNKHEHLLTGSSVLDMWPLTRAIQDTMQVPHTHDRPISQMLFNAEVNQIITVCTESVIRVWEAETGKPVYSIQEAHGPNTEVTALCVDWSGYRMATGAFDGSIKVWDFGSGHEIKKKTGRGSDDDLTITGLFYCKVNGERTLVAQGWNNKIRLLKDTNENPELVQLRDFSDMHYISREGSQATTPASINPKTPLPDINSTRGSAQITAVFKKEYLLSWHELSCLTGLNPDQLASGCSDGSIIFWNIQKSTVEKLYCGEHILRVTEFCFPCAHQEYAYGLRIPGERKTPQMLKSRGRSRSKLFSREYSQGMMGQENSKRVNVLRFLIHKVRRLDPQYIKKLTASHGVSDNGSDEEEEGNQTKRKSKRTSRATNHSRNHSAKSDQGTEIHVDQSMLDELTVKVEGEEAVAKEADLSKSDEKTEVETKTTSGSTNVESGEQVQTNPEDTVGPHKEAHIDENEEEAKDMATERNIDNDDPDSKMIVDSYPPVLITCHQDSFIRFWNMQGEFLQEVTAITRRQGSAVTSLCTDPDCHLLLTGDSKGYVTMWEIGEFLEKPNSDNKDLIKQVICWRAHLTKVSQLEYIPSNKAILSGSTDGSIRVWWGKRGRYIGFIGQPRPLNFPDSEESASNPILPYDITEGPLAPLKSTSEKENMKAHQSRYEYPLVFDNQKWHTFRRSAYLQKRMEPVSKSVEELTDKKFFKALIKPKLTKQGGSTTGEMRHGCVFRSLPVYRVQTPSKPKTPDFTHVRSDADEGFPGVLLMGNHHHNKLHKMSKTDANHHGHNNKKKCRPKHHNMLGIPESSRSSVDHSSVGITPRR